MNRLSKIRTYFLLAIIAFAISCHKKDPAPDCGCEGKTDGTISMVKASYNGKGGFYIFGSGTLYPSYSSVCNTDSSWQASPDIKIPDYTISANLKWSCFKGPTLVPLSPMLEITFIRKD